MIGGVCINTGTIPSKTLREAVTYLTGLNQRGTYGQNERVNEQITIADLLARMQHVVGREIEVIRSQLSRNQVALLPGMGSSVDNHTVEIAYGTAPGAASRPTASSSPPVPAPRGLKWWSSSTSGGRPGDRGCAHLVTTMRRCQRSSVPGVTNRLPHGAFGKIRHNARTVSGLMTS